MVSPRPLCDMSQSLLRPDLRPPAQSSMVPGASSSLQQPGRDINLADKVTEAQHTPDTKGGSRHKMSMSKIKRELRANVINPFSPRKYLGRSDKNIYHSCCSEQVVGSEQVTRGQHHGHQQPGPADAALALLGAGGHAHCHAHALHPHHGQAAARQEAWQRVVLEHHAAGNVSMSRVPCPVSRVSICPAPVPTCELFSPLSLDSRE